MARSPPAATAATPSIPFCNSPPGRPPVSPPCWTARLGGSYDLTGKGNLLLRGAYGIFYDRPFDNLWANTRLNGTALANFDILADSTNFLAPPQLSTYLLQRGNTGFPNITWVDA